jgi:hypothetical protein
MSNILQVVKVILEPILLSKDSTEEVIILEVKVHLEVVL